MPNIICEKLVHKNGKVDIVEQEFSKLWNEKIQKLEAENKVLKDKLKSVEDEKDGYMDDLDNVVIEKNELQRTILSLKSSVIDLREARDKYEHKLIVIKNEFEFVQLELDGRVWTMDDEFVLTRLKGSDSEDEDEDEE